MLSATCVLTDEICSALTTMLAGHRVTVTAENQMMVFNLTWTEGDRHVARRYLTLEWGVEPREIMTDEDLKNEWGGLPEGPTPDSIEGHFLAWLVEEDVRGVPVRAENCTRLLAKYRREHAEFEKSDEERIRAVLRTPRLVLIDNRGGTYAKYRVGHVWRDHYLRYRELVK